MTPTLPHGPLARHHLGRVLTTSVLVVATLAALTAPAGAAAPPAMTADVPSTPTANTITFVWGAVGDSYASGEGNPERGIGDANNADDFDGLRWGNDASITIPVAGRSLAADLVTCHRSDKAGVPKVHEALDDRYPGVTFKLGFVACSGAQTVNLRSSGYTGPNTRTDSLLGFARVVQPSQLGRIETLKANNGGQLDALYMSIGGNDMGFGEIIGACIVPFSNCATDWSSEILERRDALLVNYDTLQDDIVARFGTSLPVLISKYPNPLHDGAGNPPVCQGDDYHEHGETWLGGWDDVVQDEISTEEASFAFGISTTLNGAVGNAAADHGWTVVDDHVQPWLNHGLCTDVPYINLNSAAMHRQGHDTEGTGPYLFSNGFLHPNDAGFAQYAVAIENELVPLVNAKISANLTTATNLRIAAATKGGSLTVRWRDRSKAESSYDIEVVPNRTQDRDKIVRPKGATALANGGFRLRLNGAGTQQYVHAPTGAGQFRYRVRPCYTGVGTATLCASWTSYLTGTNIAPTTPTNARFTTTPIVHNGQIIGFSYRYEWDAQVGVIEYVVRRTPKATAPALADVRQSGTSITAGPVDRSNYWYQVAACNRVSCSQFTAKQ